MSLKQNFRGFKNGDIFFASRTNDTRLSNTMAVKAVAGSTTKDGKHIMAVSDEKPLIWYIASCCKFAKLKDELFEQCSLKEIMEE